MNANTKKYSSRVFICMMLLFAMQHSHSADTVMKVYSLQHRAAEEIQDMLSPLLNADERLIGRLNTLIIKATAQRQKDIQTIIQQLDTPLHNLQITVMQSTHLSADQLNAQASVWVNANNRATGHVDGHFADTRRLTSQKNTQLIRTLEGRPAIIKTGSLHPVQSVEFTASPYGESIRTSTEHIEATTGFRVIPRLSGNKVTLEISPWSGNILRNNTLAISSAHTTLQARLGEWVEIGSSGENSDQLDRGALKYRRSTTEKTLKILLKIDKINH